MGAETESLFVPPSFHAIGKERGARRTPAPNPPVAVKRAQASIAVCTLPFVWMETLRGFALSATGSCKVSTPST